jgi:hypothetical protein
VFLLLTSASRCSGDDSPDGAATTAAFEGEAMKLMHLCYAALGFAIARWVFNRQPVPVTDPVTRMRVSGLL